MNKGIYDLLFKSAVIAGFIVLIALHFSRSEKVVYVDSVKLLNGYDGMKAARKELDEKVILWKGRLDTLKQELDEKVKQYEAVKANLNAREKTLNEQLIQVKYEQFQSYQSQITEKAEKEDERLTGVVLGKINTYIKSYGEKRGYSIIMAATQYGNIVYADKDMDITDEVLKGLNAGL